MTKKKRKTICNTVCLHRLSARWRREADELDAVTGGLWIEPHVKRECADELDASLKANEHAA